MHINTLTLTEAWLNRRLMSTRYIPQFYMDVIIYPYHNSDTAFHNFFSLTFPRYMYSGWYFRKQEQYPQQTSYRALNANEM